MEVKSEKQISFGPLRLDLANECLWRDSLFIALRPKIFALLKYLLERPGQLVTKQELLDAIWPETFVGDSVLKVSIRQLREVLQDDPKNPRFIETAHRRGYRFVGRISENEQVVQSAERRSDIFASSPVSATLPSEIVGRDEAMAHMGSWLARAKSGERQLIFLTGEAGIGKTTLVDAFVQSVARDPGVLIGRGQCLEHYGIAEAYLPVLEALSQLCRGPGREQLIELLRTYAPTWLAQMPWLMKATDRDALQEGRLATTRERMLREVAEAVEAMTSDASFVLVLEDMHWSDYSTLDLIVYLARRRIPARLMVIATYRPVEVIVREHPLKGMKQELQAHRQCEELPLEYLTEQAVAQYLLARFQPNQFPNKLVRQIHQRTGGNSLFMVSAVDYLVAEGLIDRVDGQWQLKIEIENLDMRVPDSIHQMIEKQISHLSKEDQYILEAASVAGVEFSVLAVAAGLGEESAGIEERCDDLARRHQFLQSHGLIELPDGTLTSRYGFIHALFQNTFYDRVSAARRAQLHRKIGKRGEEIYGDRAGEIAAELAMHFEQGRDYKRAVKYLHRAAENAARRFANREAVSLARRGLEMVRMLPDDTHRAQSELMLRVTLGVPLMATSGYSAPEAEENYSRAHKLCQRLGEIARILPVLMGLSTFYIIRANLRMARELAEQFLRVALRDQEPDLLMESHWVMGATLIQMGEYANAQDHYEQGIALSDNLRQNFHTLHNPGIACRCGSSWALWYLGYPDQAMEKLQDAILMAQKLSHPQSLALAYFFAARQYYYRREAQQVMESAEAAINISTEQGLPQTLAWGAIMRGWAEADRGNAQEGIAQIRQSLAAQQAIGAQVGHPAFLVMLAEACQKAGQIDESLIVLDEALLDIDTTGDRFHESEIYRLKGESLLMREAKRSDQPVASEAALAGEAESSVVAEAEGCFNQAVRIARQQSAISLELRAVMSMSRLWQRQGKKEKARQELSKIYGYFTEGFETADLVEARELLNEMATN